MWYGWGVIYVYVWDRFNLNAGGMMMLLMMGGFCSNNGLYKLKGMGEIKK